MKLKVSQVLVELLSDITQQDIELDEIVSSGNILEDFMLDSIAILRLMMEIEVAFKIKVDNVEIDMELFTDFSNLTNFIESKIDEKNRTSVS